MLNIKKMEDIKKEDSHNIYVELIKMQFIARTQIIQSNVDYFIQEYEEDGLEMLVPTVLNLYGTEEKRNNITNRILENISLVEEALDNQNIIKQTPYLIYKGLYNDTFSFFTLPHVTQELFDLWYKNEYKTGLGKQYA